jgi:inosine/xanthosine triphosphate pyrophosphatase family protein
VLVFVDGNDLRLAEIAPLLAGVELGVEALTAGFATSAPEPEQKARDKVAARAAAGACFAEAVDLTTRDGKSLRLELDSENENRFCKYWRETQAVMQLRVALRRADGTIELFSAQCSGAIAARPAGPLLLGWDRLFVPDGAVSTLAEQCARGETSGLRTTAYAQLATALAR